MLRKWNYKDYYHPNLTHEEEEHMLSHAGTPSIHLLIYPHFLVH